MRGVSQQTFRKGSGTLSPAMLAPARWPAAAVVRAAWAGCRAAESRRPELNQGRSAVALALVAAGRVSYCLAVGVGALRPIAVSVPSVPSDCKVPVAEVRAEHVAARSSLIAAGQCAPIYTR